MTAWNGGQRLAGFEEQAFFEYHLYTLQRPATVVDNQTKQVSLFPSTRRRNLRRSTNIDWQRNQDRVGVSRRVRKPRRERFGHGSSRRPRARLSGRPGQGQEFSAKTTSSTRRRTRKSRCASAMPLTLSPNASRPISAASPIASPKPIIQVKLRNHKKEAVEIVVVDHFWRRLGNHQRKPTTSRKSAPPKWNSA